MSIEVTMPRLSDTMEQGTVVKWHVKEGDSVSPGDILADIETDKATMELEAFDGGTVAKLSVGEGKAVGVGNPILILAEEGEDPDEAAGGQGAKEQEADTGAAQEKDEPEKEKSEHKKDQKKDQEEDHEEDDQQKREQDDQGKHPRSTDRRAADAQRDARPSGNGAAPRDPHKGGRVFASPLARKIAQESGLDLAELTGSGPSGRIVKKDVEAALAGQTPRRPEPAPPTGPTASPGLEHRLVKLSNMRATIAKRLVESKTTIPHYQVTVEADMDALLDLRTQLNDQLQAQNVKLSVNDFLVRACALAMHQHPFVNSRWVSKGDELSVEILEDVNIAVAIALPEQRGGGLVVATLRNADRMGLRHISSETRRLAKKAREKGLSVEEMSDSTFTISNLGMYGVSHFTAIINPPNACILAVGAAEQRPVVRDGRIEIGHRMAMTISSDHRIVDGAMSAEYLNTIKQFLEAPATLLV